MTRRTRVAVLGFLAGLVVFCVVQERVTTAGVLRYVALQREAIDTGRSPVSVDGVMRPAVRASVWQGLIWGGATGVAVMLVGAVLNRSGHA